MPRTKKTTPKATPLVGAREQQLLDNLKVLKAQGRKITVSGFAKENGYANKSALRHFAVLRRELSEYVTQCYPTPQRQPSSLNVKYLESQIERQAREIERLKKQTKAIPPFKARIAKLESDKKHDAHQKKLLRGMLGTVISFLSSSDFAKARDLNARLEMQAKALMEDNEDDPSSSDK